MISTAIAFLFFVLFVVVIFLIARWGLAKVNITPDPTLMQIVSIIVFMILLAAFLRYIGVWGGGPSLWRN